MKITLINPFISSTERYGINIGAIGGHQSPLGLCYLAAFLEKYNIEVDLIDAEMEQIKNSKIIEKIRKFNPDFIGITSTTVAFCQALSLAEDIKYFNPNMPIIIGGPHVTANPAKTLAYRCFDYGVLHEGEITLLELLNALNNKKPIENIQGIAYRKNDNIACTPMREYIRDLDVLPFPARHLLLNIKKYVPPLGSYVKMPVVSMVTSRGCPYGCIFCDTNIFGNKVRYHSPEYVAAEIENMVQFYGAKEIAFLDDTFTADRKRIMNIMTLMKKKRLKINWSCMTHVNNLTKDLLEDMKSAGCWQISIGVESGNQPILDFIKKKTTLKRIRDAVEDSNNLGINVKGFFILGHPMETRNTISETINFAKAVSLTDIVVTLATPIPGTLFHSLAPDYGLLKRTDWSKFSYWEPVFVPSGLNEQILYDKQRQFYKEFYFRRRIILRQLKKIQNITLFLKYIVNLTRIILFSKKRYYAPKTASYE